MFNTTLAKIIVLMPLLAAQSCAQNSVPDAKTTEARKGEQPMFMCRASDDSGYILSLFRTGFDRKAGVPVEGVLMRGSASEKFRGRALISEKNLVANFGRIHLRASGDGEGLYVGHLSSGALSHPVECEATN
jgi:hypothetical protein